jgi:uncharacterized protein YggE
MINKKIVTLIGLILLTYFRINAQSTLDVIGVASISHKPTQTVVTFTINLKAGTYEAVITKLNSDVDGLIKSLKKQGFKTEEIITLQFNISKDRKFINGSWKDEGFVANQQLKVVFPIDQDRLIKVLKATTGSGSQPEISIGFELDNDTRTKLKKELMIATVKDAEMKAQLITSAAGYSILGIEKINYGTGGSAPTPQPIYRMAEATLGNDAAGFSPMEGQSVSITDQIHITYRISQN